MKKAKKRKKIRINQKTAIVSIFLFSIAFFLYSRLGIASNNVILQKKEQNLSSEISNLKKEIAELEVEINNISNKTRVLSLLGDTYSDNQHNIYVVDTHSH